MRSYREYYNLAKDEHLTWLAMPEQQNEWWKKDEYNRFKELCEQNDINYQVEVCAGRTGTNADCIAIMKSGVRTMLVSVPEKNMHTQAEIVSLDDVLDTAKVISEYIISGGVDYEL